MELTFIGWGYVGVGLGAGLAVVGAGLGIGKLVAAALEGSARQPEMAGKLQTTMIIGAALIEGLGLLALITSLLTGLTLNGIAKSATDRSGSTAMQSTGH